MKRVLFATVLMFLMVGLVAFTMVQKGSESLSRLGVPEADAKDFIWWSFSGGVFSYPNTEKVKGTPRSERARVVQDICAYARAYAESDAFKQRYFEEREQRKPSPPQKPEPMAGMRKRLKKEGEKSISDFKAGMSSLPADQQEALKGTLSVMEEQVKSYDDPNNPMFSKEMEAAMQQGYEAQVADHKKQLIEWDKNNPADPRFMVKRWLEGFLEESKDINFDAGVTKDENGKIYFVKSEHEMKSANWKLCYRAGKEAVDAARTYAKQWLADLNKKIKE